MSQLLFNHTLGLIYQRWDKLYITHNLEDHPWNTHQQNALFWVLKVAYVI